VVPPLASVAGAIRRTAPGQDQLVMWAVFTACWNIARSAELMSAGVFAV
jgi:hypothetical protein